MGTDAQKNDTIRKMETPKRKEDRRANCEYNARQQHSLLNR